MTKATNLWEMTDEEKNREPIKTLLETAKNLEARRLCDGMSFAAEMQLEQDGDRFLEALDTAYDSGDINEEIYGDFCGIAFYDYGGSIPSYLDK